MTYVGNRGFILVTVLIVTAVGLLFGAGALLLFRFQCQQRIDRQHELEKIYAIRSALNWARTYDTLLPPDGISQKYYTGSSRSLGVLVKPVEYIFPDINFVSNDVRHLVIEGVRDEGEVYRENDGNGIKRILTISPTLYPSQYNPGLDYEYGMMTNVVTSGDVESIEPNLALVDKVDEQGITSYEKENEEAKPEFGINFPNSTTNNVKWWVNIGMRGKGGWVQDEYGRRFLFGIKDFIGSFEDGYTSDVLHFCIVRENYHPSNPIGCRHGWPLSVGESALVLKLTKGEAGSHAYLVLYEYVYGKAPVLLASLGISNISFEMGVQLSGKKVALFWYDGSSQTGGTQVPIGIKQGDRELSDATYLYFRGNDIDADGRVRRAPDLRAVFEIVALASVRTGTGVVLPTQGEIISSSEDFIEKFAVEPAYQYDVFLKCPNVVYSQPFGVRATVAQLLYSTNKVPPIITYDTHGTEHRGFRYDERHPNGE